ncbi:MAG TPA: FtsW/RodA/SpoVE family cell cycle protein [Actinomycetota bacterium]|nr:FtsW/RodA/SpoVE family cell cycle protein [Actinomycetota bacterium]
MSAIEARRARPAGSTLAFTIFAVVLSIGAYVIAGFGKRGHLPSTFVLYAAIFVAGYLGAFFVGRRMAPGADPALFATAGVLTGLGFAMIFRLSGGLAAEQVTWIAVGLAAYALTLVVIRDHRQLDAYTYTIGLLGLVLLLLPVVPGIGKEINGARLWVSLGPIGFQPSEIAKVLIVVFLASYLTTKRELLQVATTRLGPLRLPAPRHLAPVALAWAVSLAVLFLQRDMGASLLFFGIFVVMLWVATGRTAYLVLGAVLFAIGAWVGYLAFSHVQLRVDVWLHALEPSKVHGIGYGQLAQAQFGMATGGLVGAGLGRGSPGLIPFASTDFIFAAIGEELGLLGTTAVLLLYVALVGKGLAIALRTSDGFGQLIATGLSVIVGLQAFVIVGGVTRVIPLTGVTLPFVSYGGSSLLANFVLLALLVRIASGPARSRRGARVRAPWGGAGATDPQG